MYCECECGQLAPIAKRSDNTRGYIKGQPVRFIHGHNARGKQPNWKGGKIKVHGYICVWMPNHPFATQHGYIREQRLVAEKVLGRFLKPEEVTHHYGEKNENKKIVICENQSYHILLHQRMRALKACGHASWLKCWLCKQYDDSKNMHIVKGKYSGFHRECKNKYQRKLRREKADGTSTNISRKNAIPTYGCA